MTVFKLPLSALGGQYKKLGAGVKVAAAKGIQRGAFRVQATLQQLTGQAPPANPNGIGTGGAVNTGFYKKAWKIQMLPDGARVFNAATYAGIIDFGRRPGKFPPKEVIVRWIQRRLQKPEKEARKMAFVVQRAIAKRGLLARRVLSGNVPMLKQIWAEELTKELDAALLAVLGGKAP